MCQAVLRSQLTALPPHLPVAPLPKACIRSAKAAARGCRISHQHLSRSAVQMPLIAGHLQSYSDAGVG
eukprot:CAMPEP_0204583000 /NCGR_PEP_ID=MMETSP0661-20131031/45532_1 /ASSEMBLY_ACC=CAM_ASM_000606 /TAXON_ID=109239 /ORGANISM="Alexandrium margalefi, Strain AMGDE01CS-322" /LENGTH=67 /DNA_ID=CAMNT_0051592323 /DNA_START=164 /DNA_END=363 /DNA_ORIENTATION=+